MELRHLRCFAVLAEEVHLGRTAERLRSESSFLSRAIKGLEERRGVPLFERITRRPALTRDGQALLERDTGFSTTWISVNHGRPALG